MVVVELVGWWVDERKVCEERVERLGSIAGMQGILAEEGRGERCHGGV